MNSRSQQRIYVLMLRTIWWGGCVPPTPLWKRLWHNFVLWPLGVAVRWLGILALTWL